LHPFDKSKDLCYDVKFECDIFSYDTRIIENLFIDPRLVFASYSSFIFSAFNGFTAENQTIRDSIRTHKNSVIKIHLDNLIIIPTVPLNVSNF